MATNFLLITSTLPVKGELSNLLLKPEKDKSKYIIKIDSAISIQKDQPKLIIPDIFKFQILNNTGEVSSILLNHLIVSAIEYDVMTTDISFFVNQGQIIYNQRISLKRVSASISDDIINGLKKISEISTDINVSTISRI